VMKGRLRKTGMYLGGGGTENREGGGDGKGRGGERGKRFEDGEKNGEGRVDRE
jgi:hypothetical protein